MQYLVLAAALASASLAAAQLTVNTPASLVECQPAALSWSGGTAPYFPSIIPGGQPSAAALESFPESSNTSITWTVDVASGRSVTLQIRDSTGSINYSDQVTVQAGTSASCVGQSSASSAAVTATTAAGANAAGSTGAATGAATGTASAATGSTIHASSSASSPSSSSTHTSSASSSTSSNSGAEKVSAVFTVVAAALFALFA